MAESAATPPKPPGPKAAGNKLAGIFKGKPMWVWIAGITVLVGVAYMARRRSVAAAQDGAIPTVVDNTTGSVGDESLYPSASQGAYGGYSSPSDAYTDPTINDNAGAPEIPPIIINIPGPQDLSTAGTPGFNPSGQEPASAITGGGKGANVGVSNHKPVQTPLQKALARVNVIQAAAPAHAATAAQVTAQAKAAVAPNIFTQDAGSRSGLNYKLVQKDKKWYRFYESRPGKGDWGNGGKIPR